MKNPTEDQISVFSNEDVVICGVVRSELMHGAKSDADLLRISETLAEFEELNIENAEWPIFGKMLYRLRSHGITVPFQDALIAFLCVKHDVHLWTNDKHFQIMQKILSELKIFNIVESRDKE